MIETPEIVGVTTDEASIMLPIGTLNLYRQSESTGWDLIAENTSGKYTDYDITPGKTYDYSIREVKDGIEGHRSDIAEVTIPDMPVEAVTDWNPDNNAAEATISLQEGKYNIYRDGELVGTSDGSDTYLDEDLEGDQEYSYQVAKINDGVEGQLSDAVEVTTPASDQMDDLEELGIDTSQLDESDLEAMGLADIDMNDPEERALAMDILRNEIGKTLHGDMIDASSELKDGGSADSWWLTIAALLGGGLTLAGLIGAGGMDNFTETARRKTEEEAADQFDYLDGFADDVAAGKQSEAQIDSRLGLYGNSLGSVASNVRHDDALNNFKFAKRNLMIGAQHCKNCIAYAGYWMPIEDCPPIGENCQCTVNCLCDIEYSETDPRETGDEDDVDESPQDYAKKLADRWDFSELVENGTDMEFAALFYNQDEPRDSHGKWTSGGGSEHKAVGGLSDLTKAANEARTKAKVSKNSQDLYASYMAHKNASEAYGDAAYKADDLKRRDKLFATADAHRSAAKKSKEEWRAAVNSPEGAKKIKDSIANDKEVQLIMKNSLAAMGGGGDAEKNYKDAETARNKASLEWSKNPTDEATKKLEDARKVFSEASHAKYGGGEQDETKNREALIKSVGVKSPGEIKVTLAKGFAPDQKQKKSINDALSFIKSFSTHNANLKFEFSGDRAHYDDTTGVINIGGGKVSSIVHEAAHAIEQSTPKVAAMTREFLAMRLGGEAPIDMAAFGMPGEMGRKDNFDKAFGEAGAYYIGKDYGDVATEVLSMGIQKLYEEPKSFLEKDPEYAAFVIKALRAK